MKKIISIIALVAVLAAALCACGGSNSKTQPLSDIFAQIKNEYKITDMVEFEDISTLDKFYGITADDVDEFAGGINNSGVNQEEIVFVKAKDAEKAKAIAEKLNARLKSKLNETKNYNPEQYAIIEKSNVDIDNLYISLIISENLDGIKKMYKEGIGVS